MRSPIKDNVMLTEMPKIMHPCNLIEVTEQNMFSLWKAYVYRNTCIIREQGLQKYF